ncbi:MAG: hypothetical protein R2813_01715 [Flavobacteriales bacterium]
MSLGLVANAQFVRVPLDIYSTLRAERSLSDSAYSVHPEIKPYDTWDVQEIPSGITKDEEAGGSERQDLDFTQRTRSCFTRSAKRPALVLSRASMAEELSSRTLGQALP